MTARKFLPYVLIVFALLLASCADSKQKAIKVGDKFMEAFVVDVDFGVLMKYSTGDAQKNVEKTCKELGEDGIADLRKKTKEAKMKFELDEEQSRFTKGIVNLVYELRVGPDYDKVYFAHLELIGGRGVWKVSFYSI